MIIGEKNHSFESESFESPDLVHKTGLNESFLNLPDSGLQFITDSFLMSSEDEWINFTT